MAALAALPGLGTGVDAGIAVDVGAGGCAADSRPAHGVMGISRAAGWHPRVASHFSAAGFSFSCLGGAVHNGAGRHHHRHHAPTVSQRIDLHMESYLEENRDGFVHQTVGQYLTELVESRGKKRADVIKAADIHTSYAYAIFAGQKFPARDKILRLALAMQLTLEECQRCLKFCQYPVLYPKIRRDAVLIRALHTHQSVLLCNQALDDVGEKPLD